MFALKCVACNKVVNMGSEQLTTVNELAAVMMELFGGADMKLLFS